MADVVEINAITGEMVERPFTAEEKAQRQADAAVASTQAALLDSMQTNRATLQQQATTAMAQNRAAIAATSPTNAQVIQQVKNLSAQNNALIRLVLGLLDATD